jgi:hypothetical protein
MKYLLITWLVILSKEKQDNVYSYETKTDLGAKGCLYTPIEYKVGDTIRLK